jgi:chromosome segregation ATPase
MSENSWILRGVDPETREAAAAEAERRGISLADFLTEVLLTGPEDAASESAPDFDAHAEAMFAAPPPSRENLAFRRRIEALERRLASSVGGLDAAVQELDASLLGIVARMDEAEAVTGETSETLRTALADLGVNIAALRKRLADVEDGIEDLTDTNDAAHADLDDRCATLEARLAQVDSIARAAAAAEATLNAAYGALQQAVAHDFNDFAEEQATHLSAAVEHMRGIAESAARGADEAAARAVEALRVARMELEARVSGHIADTRAYLDASLEDVRLTALAASQRADEVSVNTAQALGVTCDEIERHVAEHSAQGRAEVQAALDDMRVFAYEAARRADEAAARAVDALRSSREAIEAGVAEQAADLRARMQSAFADAADRMGGLTERVVETETAIVRSAQQLNARIIDVEDNAHTAIEATGERLRSELSAAMADMMERHRGETARFNAIDASMADAASNMVALRTHVDGRLAEFSDEMGLAQRQSVLDTDARLSAIAVRLAEAEQDTAHARQSLGADIVRVESCTFAALEKLAQDITTASAEQQHVARDNTVMLEAGLAEGRDQIAGVLARLRIVDGARIEAEQSLAAMKDEIAGLSSIAVQNETTRQALAALEARIDHNLADLRARSEQALKDLHAGLATLAANRRAEEAMAQKIDELRARLVTHETQMSENADRTQSVTRMLGRITAQSAEVSDHTDERLHKLEQVMQQPHFGGASDESAHELAERLAQMERRQADALDGLTASLAGFMAESERRLSEIEQHAGAAPISDETLIANAIEARLTALEQFDVADQLETVRRRFEDRIVGLEGRSVRALEQVAETVAMIERRFNQGEDEADLAARSA